MTAPWEGDLVHHNPLPDPLDNDDDNEDIDSDLIENSIQSDDQDAEDGDLLSLRSRIEHMAIVPFNSSPHSAAVVAPPRTTKKDIYFCRVFRPALIQLRIAIVTHFPQTATDGQWFSVFLSFIILASIKNKGEFLPAGEITQLISAILFVYHLTKFNIIRNHVSNNPTQRYEASVSPFTSFLSTAHLHRPQSIRACREIFPREKRRNHTYSLPSQAAPALNLLCRESSSCVQLD